MNPLKEAIIDYVNGQTTDSEFFRALHKIFNTRNHVGENAMLAFYNDVKALVRQNINLANILQSILS